MKTNEFYSMFANLPLADRGKPIDFEKLGVGILGTMTLSDVYKEVHTIDNKIRNDVCRMDKLIMAVEWYFYKLKEK